MPYSSSPSSLTVVGNHLFFIAASADHGSELWVNDAATGETRLVADLEPGAADSLITEIVPFGEGIFFRLDDNFHDYHADHYGSEIWFSDGTAEGTTLLADLVEGPEGSKCFGDYLGDAMIEFYGSVIFRANDFLHGCELFISDGTPEGTSLLADIYEDSDFDPDFEGESSDPDEFTVIGNSLYFRATDESGRGTWKFQQDGTLQRAVLGSGIPPVPANFTAVGDNVFFSGDDGIKGTELYVHRLEPSLSINVMEILAKDIAYQDWEEGEIIALDALGYSDFPVQFTVDRFFQDPVTGFDAVGLVSTVDNPILAIRGSVEFLTDWFDDFHPDGVGTGQFLANYADVESWLDSVSTPADPVSIVGHSLGGGLTQLVAAQYTANGGFIDQVVTFNAPGINADYEAMFRSDRTGSVVHYITNGDPVSMAGDAFLEGRWVRATFPDINLIHNHVLPLTVPFTYAGDLRDEIRDRPVGLTFETFADTSWLSHPLYFHNDADYLTILATAYAITLEVESLQPYSYLPASLLFRSTTEAQRQTIGQIWQELQPLILTATGSASCDPEEDTFAVSDVNFSLLGLLDVEATGLMASCHPDPEPSVWLQGEVRLPDFFNVTANFTDDHRIQLAGNEIELIGEVTAESIPIVPNFLEVKQAGIGINTLDNTLQAGAQLDIKPWGVLLGVDLGFLNNEWNSIAIDLSGITVPIPFLPGGILNRIGGNVQHIAPSDPDPIAFGGNIGMTLGPQVSVNLPAWAGGPINAKLLGFDGGASFDNEHLEVTADLSIINGLATVDGTTEWNWAEGTLSATGGFNVLDGLIVSDNSSFNASIDEHMKLNLHSAANATFTVPDVLPLIGGTSAFDGDFFFQYSDDGVLSNDSTGAHAAFDLPLVGETGLGFRLWFDGSLTLIGAEEIEELTTIAEGESIGISEPPSKRVLVDAGHEWVLFSAEFDEASEMQLVLTTPDGETLSEADIAAAENMAIVDQLVNSKRRLVIVSQPASGTWTVSVDQVEDTAVNLIAVADNSAPSVQITEVNGGALREPVVISYVASDPDNDAAISLYYDHNGTGSDGVLVGTGNITESADAGELIWDTSSVPVGDYFVYVVVDDGINAPTTVYSSAVVSVTARNITGTIWNDANMDANRSDSESTVPDVLVFADVNDNAILDDGEPFSLTKSDGTYQLNDIDGGWHQVRIVPPNGFVQVYPTGGRSHSVELLEIASEVDFAVSVFPASLSGAVWQDINRDGFRDDTEQLRQGITVRLIESGSSQTVAETTTNEHGAYSFASIVPGSYVVEVVMNDIDGISRADRPGSDAHDSHADPISSQFMIDLQSAAQMKSYDVALFSKANNFANRYDVNVDDQVTNRDALAVINYLARQSSFSVTPAESFTPEGPFYDVSGNGAVTPLDALHVINRLSVINRSLMNVQGESEGVMSPLTTREQIQTSNVGVDDANGRATELLPAKTPTRDQPFSPLSVKAANLIFADPSIDWGSGDADRLTELEDEVALFEGVTKAIGTDQLS